MRRIKTYSRKEVPVSNTDPWFSLIGRKNTRQADYIDNSSISEQSGLSSVSSYSSNELNSYPESSSVLFQSPVEDVNFKPLGPKKVNFDCKRGQKRNVQKETKLLTRTNKTQELNAVSSSKLNITEIENFSLVVEKFSQRNDKCYSEKTCQILHDCDQSNPSSTSPVVDKISQCDSYALVENAYLLSVNRIQPVHHTGIVHNCASFSLFEPVSPKENIESNKCETLHCTKENSYITHPLPFDLCGKPIALEQRWFEDIQNATERDNFTPIRRKQQNLSAKSLLSTSENSASSFSLFPSCRNKDLLLEKNKGKNTKPYCSTPLSVSYRKFSIPLSSVKSKAHQKKVLHGGVNWEIQIDRACTNSGLTPHSPVENYTGSFNSSVCFKKIHENSFPQRNYSMSKVSCNTVYSFDSATETSELFSELNKENNKFMEGIADSCKAESKLQKSVTIEKSFHNDEHQTLMSSSRKHHLSVQRIVDLDGNTAHSPICEKLGSSNSKTYCDNVSLLAGFFDVSCSSLTPKEKILEICDEKDIIMFSEAYDWKNIKICRKIGEGSFGEVYALNAVKGKKVVIKVIPVAEKSNTENGHQKTFEDIFSEIAISKCLSEMRNSTFNQTRNFTKLNRARCLKGSAPSKLLSAWRNFKLLRGSESVNPDTYSEDQLYVVLEFDHGGLALGKFQLKNPLEAKSIFYQVTCTLAVAEAEYCFEHRDLHVENILVSRTKMKYIRYTLNGHKFQFLTHGVLVTVIDFTLSRISDKGGIIFSDLNSEPSLFEGQGDYQFAVYRMTRDYVEKDWREFVPYTNVLWLHYLAKKLCNYTYLRCTAKSHFQACDFLKEMDKNILNCENAVEVVEKINVLKS